MKNETDDRDDEDDGDAADCWGAFASSSQNFTSQKLKTWEEKNFSLPLFRFLIVVIFTFSPFLIFTFSTSISHSFKIKVTSLFYG